VLFRSPNPAFLNNMCYSYVWFGCVKRFEQSLDGNEDIKVIELPLNQIKDYIKDKKIQHSLVMNAFLYLSMNYGLI
ncbi:MAG: ADP-ribose pyrophosphatase, partial [Bacteroidota bacterium]|nr:ADP-ribose pyrophosphatase [Bacteroidota bacterium]